MQKPPTKSRRDRKRGFLHNNYSSIRLKSPLKNAVFGSNNWEMSRIFRIFEP